MGLELECRNNQIEEKSWFKFLYNQGQAWQPCTKIKDTVYVHCVAYRAVGVMNRADSIQITVCNEPNLENKFKVDSQTPIIQWINHENGLSSMGKNVHLSSSTVVLKPTLSCDFKAQGILARLNILHVIMEKTNILLLIMINNGIDHMLCQQYDQSDTRCLEQFKTKCNTEINYWFLRGKSTYQNFCTSKVTDLDLMG